MVGAALSNPMMTIHVVITALSCITTIIVAILHRRVTVIHKLMNGRTDRLLKRIVELESR